LRVFLDTNVLVSAFAARGLCADLFEVVLTEHELVAGDKVLAELRRALRAKLGLPAPQADSIVDFVRNATRARVAKSSPATARVDADDAAILGEALAGRTAAFVTGDAAIQRLREFDGMTILSPRQFWTLLQSGV
jgi:predicted nucleic acid-binding protein